MLSSTQAATLQAIIYHYRLKYFLNFRSISLNLLSNLRIGFNNNFITNSSYAKFLGVTMDNTLSWNNDIDLLVKKLCTACYKIRNATTYVCLIIKNDYAFFLFGYELWNYILGKLAAQFYNF